MKTSPRDYSPQRRGDAEKTNAEDATCLFFSASPRLCGKKNRRGVIFITALGIIIILSGLLLAFAQSMRTNAIESANRLSYAQADAVEQGAEMWVLAQVESYPADAVTITQVPAEGLQVGGGYFWILNPDPTQDQNYNFGIADESAKLNINTATSDQLMSLPNMTDETVADSIVNWAASGDATPQPDGAESDYYSSLPDQPYQCKNATFETVEELLLVENVTPSLLYGYDLNHDGVVDAGEQQSAGASGMFISAGGTSTDARGIFNYVTCYSVEPNTSINGTPRVNVNSRNTSALQNVLNASLSKTRANAIMAQINIIYASNRSAIVFPTLGAFYARSTLTATEFGLVADQLTATTAKTLPGLINVNTAPVQVLQCLPGLDSSDAQSLVSQRGTGANTGSYAWVFNALSASKAQAITGAITARSFQYSADIVAVSGDGRAFKRVRIVVDSRTLPAQVIYRRDLTYLGWPLPPEVRTSMRTGKGVPASVSNPSVMQ